MNNNQRNAKREKNDEFYTQISDIEKELKHYKEQFKNKIVFCNCDDPEYSNFWRYFKLYFRHLELKKLIATHYERDKPSYKLEYDGIETIKTTLTENGDFRSPESIEILESVDIVITNPPFSLFREYVGQLIEHKKSFVIMGNNNAVSYREIFSLIKNNMLFTGHHVNKTMEFELPDSYTRWDRQDELGKKYGKVPAITWFTNMDIPKRHEVLTLYKLYDPDAYQKYDNYDAINVDKVTDIPCDYEENMGVPITFMDKYNPEQFEIIDAIGRYSMLTGPTEETKGKYLTEINGNPKYARIIIKRRKSK